MLNEIKFYQQDFITYVTNILHNRFDLSHDGKILKSETKHRIAVYQKSFKIRTITSICEILFSQLKDIFGSAVIEEVIARYYIDNPPSSCLVSSLSYLPAFVRNCSSTDWYSQFFADMIELSLKYREFVYSNDQDEFFFFPSAISADFFSAWTSSEQINVSKEIYALKNPKNSTSILFIKNSPIEIVPIKIPSNLKNFILLLIEKKSIKLALELLPTSEIESIIENDFNAFLSDIKKQNMIHFLNG